MKAENDKDSSSRKTKLDGLQQSISASTPRKRGLSSTVTVTVEQSAGAHAGRVQLT